MLANAGHQPAERCHVEPVLHHDRAVFEYAARHRYDLCILDRNLGRLSRSLCMRGIRQHQQRGVNAGMELHCRECSRVAGTAAFLAFASASESIWKGQPWSITAKHLFDSLVYGLLTGGVFGWLWP